VGDKCRWSGLKLATFNEKRAITQKRYKIDGMAAFKLKYVSCVSVAVVVGPEYMSIDDDDVLPYRKPTLITVVCWLTSSQKSSQYRRRTQSTTKAQVDCS